MSKKETTNKEVAIHIIEDWYVTKDFDMSFVLCRQGINSKNGEKYFTDKTYYGNLPALARALREKFNIKHFLIDKAEEIISAYDKTEKNLIEAIKTLPRIERKENED